MKRAKKTDRGITAASLRAYWAAQESAQYAEIVATKARETACNAEEMLIAQALASIGFSVTQGATLIPSDSGYVIDDPFDRKRYCRIHPDGAVTPEELPNGWYLSGPSLTVIRGGVA